MIFLLLSLELFWEIDPSQKDQLEKIVISAVENIEVVEWICMLKLVKEDMKLLKKKSLKMKEFHFHLSRRILISTDNSLP